MPRFLFPVAVLLLPAFVAADSVTLERPIDGAVIFGDRVEVTGVANGSHRVMLMTQEINSSGPWRVAKVVRPDADGRFAAAFRLPNIKQDLAYRVIAIGAKRIGSLRSTQPGTLMRKPPAGMRHSEIVRIAIAGTAKSALSSGAATERILLPVANSIVGPSDTVVIEGAGDPAAVVLIRENEAGSPWYVQGAVEKVGLGRSAVTVRFGSSRSPAGSRFLVRLAIPQTEEQREFFKVGEPIAELPASIPYGRPISLRLDPRKDPAVDLAQLRIRHALTNHDRAVRLTSPADGSSTGRRALIQGTCPTGLVPVLMVRSEDDLATWYVQPPCQRNAAAFENRIYLGKLGTRTGTRFQVIAMLLPPDQAKRYEAGKALTELPEDARVSQPLLLIHTGSDE